MDKVKRLTIDYLFRSLAEDLKEKSIGILLSGTGTDGTLGLRKIKGEGGMAMVQDPDTTRYNGMLESAINNIVVDYILPTEIMPEKLIEYIKTIYGKLEKHREFSEKNIQEPLDKIFDIIRSYMGHEFSAYKNTTILRRIERRMTVNQINSLDNYIKYLIVNEDEIYKLSHELLIGVTGFFRDQETFGAFEKKVVPQ
ncbi:MAG: chemotaxis protein CheB, partial [Candidatus Lokiarchaeota archaeon]